VSGRVARWLLRGAGLALIAVLIGWVGWQDRVVDGSGTEHRGRILAREPGRVLLLPQDDASPSHWIPVEDDAQVHEGLRGVLLGFAHRPALAALGFALHAAGLLLTWVRWHVLLRGAALPTGIGEVLRLSWIGNFAGMLLPGGLTSGDLVKGVAITRHHAHARTRAVLTIVIDRVLGLLALGALAGAALLFAPRVEELHAVRVVLLVMLGGAAVGALLLFSPRARAWTPLARIAALLPFPALVAELGDGLEMYRARPATLAGAWLLGAAGQLFYLVAFAVYATAMGGPLPLLAVGAGVPAALLVQAVPALPGGWGLGDVGFVVCLAAFGVPAGAALGLSFTQRALQTLLVLPGGLMLARARRDDAVAAAPSG